MSKQIINISTPDDGLGDVLRNGFDKTNQNFTELYNGKVDKITGKGLSKNDFTDTDKAKLDGIESGAEVNVQADWGETDPLAKSFILNKPPSLYSAFGYFHISDLATQTTPLAFLAATPLQLTNDNAGAFTSEDNAPYGVPKIWNASTNALDFTHLSVGDAVLVRADLLISTTSVNQNLRLYIKFGVGTPSEYDLLIDSWNEKSVVTFEEFVKDVSFSIDNEDWRDVPAKIYILSDDDGSVKVNGWYVPIIRKSINVIDFNSDPLKLDKDTTAGVERVYTINADGSQGTKATSDFKDVLEFANLASFPTTGETGIIYIALDKGLTYRWTGSAYVQIGGSGEEISVYNNESQLNVIVFQTTFQSINYNEGIVTSGSATYVADRFIKYTSTAQTNQLFGYRGNNGVTSISNSNKRYVFWFSKGEIISGNFLSVGCSGGSGLFVSNFPGIGVIFGHGASDINFKVVINGVYFDLGSEFPISTDFYRVSFLFRDGNVICDVKNMTNGKKTSITHSVPTNVVIGAVHLSGGTLSTSTAASLLIRRIKIINYEN